MQFELKLDYLTIRTHRQISPIKNRYELSLDFFKDDMQKLILFHAIKMGDILLLCRAKRGCYG